MSFFATVIHYHCVGTMGWSALYIIVLPFINTVCIPTVSVFLPSSLKKKKKKKTHSDVDLPRPFLVPLPVLSVEYIYIPRVPSFPGFPNLDYSNLSYLSIYLYNPSALLYTFFFFLKKKGCTYCTVSLFEFKVQDLLTYLLTYSKKASDQTSTNQFLLPPNNKYSIYLVQTIEKKKKKKSMVPSKLYVCTYIPISHRLVDRTY